MTRNDYPSNRHWLTAPFVLSADNGILLDEPNGIPLHDDDHGATGAPPDASDTAMQMAGHGDLPYDPQDAGYVALTMEEWEEANGHWTTGMAVRE